MRATQELYNPSSDEFIIEGYQMRSGQGEAVMRKYNAYVGKSGNTWLVADQEAAGENVYVTDSPLNNGKQGFGGATLNMPLVSGEVFALRGGWHSNCQALFEDTGVDVRDTHRTFVVLSEGRDSTPDGTYRTLMKKVLYKDDAPKLGSFDRYKELVKLYPAANYYYSQSSGGSSCGPIHADDRL